jgi:hypothetical protein
MLKIRQSILTYAASVSQSTTALLKRKNQLQSAKAQLRK